jgi:C-terminal processing protease CtpA/Prc
MKAGGLLLLLLIGIGLYLYLSATSAQSTLKASKLPKEQATEISGHGMKESFRVEPVDKDGKTVALKLVELDPDGPLAHMYDLKIGDEITDVGISRVRDDADMAKAMLLESGYRQNVLIVQRNGQKLELTNHGAASGKQNDRTPGGNLNPLNNP